MEDIPVKNDGDTYTASEFNNVESQEPQNVVANAGITFDAANLTQLAESAHVLMSNAPRCLDSGVVNAYVLSNLSSVAISAYYDGLVCTFETANANTGASTIDLNGLGVIPVVDMTLSPLTGGEISTSLINRVVYNSGNFILLVADSNAGTYRANLANQTIGSEGANLVGATNTTLQSIICRARARVVWTGGSPYKILDEYNVSNVTWTKGVLAAHVTVISTITFKVPMDTTDYVITCSPISPVYQFDGSVYTAPIYPTPMLNTKTRNSFSLTFFVSTFFSNFSFEIHEYRP